MAEMRKGNLFWKSNVDPISETNPVHAKDVNSDDNLAKLEQVRVLLSGVATEAKLEQARLLLANLDGKDFATDAELVLVKSQLQTLETKLDSLATILTDGTQKVQQSGTDMEHFGVDVSERPPANSVPVGATFMVVGTTQVWQSNGFEWVVM